MQYTIFVDSSTKHALIMNQFYYATLMKAIDFLAKQKLNDP